MITRECLFIFAAIVALFQTSVLPALAESPPLEPREEGFTKIHFGFKGGMSLTQHQGIEPRDLQYTVSSSMRKGIAAGAFIILPVTERFGIQQEVLYVQKGSWQEIGADVPYTAKGMSIVKFRGRTTQVYYSRDYYTEGDIMANIPGLDEAILGFRTFYRCAVDPTYDCPLEGSMALADLELEGKKSDLPQPAATFQLMQNAPNPFNPVTKISFKAPEGGANVALRIYDLTGKLVRTLVNGHEQGGIHEVSWYGTNDQGQPVSSGTYFYQLTAPSFSEKRKMVLLK